ncbi:glycosyl hydrolase [Segetibacter koreensis]|uniref:glycosyl hydrolase n=1 Tax=Segetibacter koreensis TaxID=398037 RepID=UPI00037AC5DF|nr:glycosyl hydrolase [Segetibacter koreensis]
MLLLKKIVIFINAVFLITTFFCSCSNKLVRTEKAYDFEVTPLRSGFLNPPDSARPGVYWYFMDGNLSREGMTADLESMKKAGIGHLIFLEVNVGIPRGPVDFLSDKWLELFKHAVDECKRLGIAMTLGIGPGWTGSGGPWVSPDQSMQQLVSSSTLVSGDENKRIKLPLPIPKKPYFGEGVFTSDLKKKWDDFYEDVAVLAFPTPLIEKKINDIDEKALYYRAPYSSVPGVKPFLPSLANYSDFPGEASISKSRILDLTNKLQPDGTLDWEVPKGNWTIMRFGRRNNGAVTRPAPIPGLGFESDKFDTAALNAHLNKYTGKIFSKVGTPDPRSAGGLKALHMDSWEMGAQNWTKQFRQEFIKRRGYDPLPYYPVYAGNIVESQEISERFLWDLRQTSQELVLNYHAEQVKRYSHRHGLHLSIEPYDMNPTADLELGTIADVIMCEFWSKGYGFNSTFSCVEATSIAHIKGHSLVQAEAFTADGTEAWKQYPGSMKNQGDWAFAAGINRFFYHTFEHKPLDEKLRPGMTMGPYGVHWDRKQTWWPMASAYHQYVSKCQYILQKGKAVADVLYLTPEGAPQVFLPPPSALDGNDTIPDRRGYNFDGCSPGQLFAASVKDNQIVFPGGASYRLLVLPAIKTMTPALLEKVRSLVNEGATVVGNPPTKAPGLSGFPLSDQKVQSLAREIWGRADLPSLLTEHAYGKGRVVFGGSLIAKPENSLYPAYDLTASLIKKMGVSEDFESSGPVRYTHRTTNDMDIYFVANRTDQAINAVCTFRTTKGTPELWDPITGKTRILPEFSTNNGRTTIPLQFESYQSFFIVFGKNRTTPLPGKKNFPAKKELETLSGSWAVSFDPKWGGHEKIFFDHLVDWTSRPEEGVKFYSGVAVYRKSFNLPSGTITDKPLYLDLGEVKNMARIRLNGKELGVVWTAPWKVDITGAVKQNGNQLEIEVANLWPNRLIGDQRFPDDGIKDEKFPEWLLAGKERNSGRYAFTTYNPYKKDAPLLESGLIGPVTIQQIEF